MFAILHALGMFVAESGLGLDAQKAAAKAGAAASSQCLAVVSDTSLAAARLLVS